MDPDTLTPTEYLMMEVLAARLRLGENHWTFPTRCRPTARSLEEKGYIGWKSGVVEGTIQAWMTIEAELLFLSPTYVAPAT